MCYGTKVHGKATIDALANQSGRQRSNRSEFDPLDKLVVRLFDVDRDDPDVVL